MKLKQTFLITGSIFTIMLDLSVIISQLYVLFSHNNNAIAIFLILFAVIVSLANATLSTILCNKKYSNNKYLTFINLGLTLLLFIIFILALSFNFKIYGFYFTLPLAILAITFNVVSIALSNSDTNSTSLKEKIHLLKQLKEAGELTEEEYKALLLKELEKNN